MIRIGVFSDIHSDYAALFAMIDKMPECDEYVCLGDLVCMGGNPNECFALLKTFDNLTYLKGNHDEAVEMIGRGITPAGYPDAVVEHQKFFADIISDECARMISSAPYILERVCDGMKITFLHYASRDGVWAQSDDPIAALKDVDGDVIVFGHTHEAFDKTVGKRYLSFGSLGCPHAKIGVGYAGILEIDRGKCLAKKIKIEYDIREPIESLKRLSPPNLKFVLKKFYGEDYND